MFRNKLSHIKTEEELFEFFSSHAGYDEQVGIYRCAGLADSDTRNLFLKLKAAWEEDVVQDAVILLSK